MNMVDVSSSADAASEHDKVWSLLPWLINNSLSSVERALVEAHLKECLSCRRESLGLKALANHIAKPVAKDECETALRRLTQRLDHTLQRPRQLPWAAAAVMVLSVSLMGWLTDNTEASTAWLRNAGSIMLSADVTHVSGAGGPQVRLAFSDDITERQLRSLVLGVGAVVVEGPTPRGIYTLEFSRDTGADDVMEAIRKLRYSQRVIFAEPTSNMTSVSDHATDWPH